LVRPAISQPLALDAFERNRGALFIVNFESGAVAVAEFKFRRAAMRA
jgi:hypothetical protein